MSDTDPTSIPCPICPAGPGETCETAEVTPRPRAAHQSRKRIARGVEPIPTSNRPTPIVTDNRPTEEL